MIFTSFFFWLFARIVKKAFEKFLKKVSSYDVILNTHAIFIFWTKIILIIFISIWEIIILAASLYRFTTYAISWCQLNYFDCGINDVIVQDLISWILILFWLGLWFTITHESYNIVQKCIFFNPRIRIRI